MSGSNKRILVISDDESVMESLKLILNNEYDLIFIEDAFQAAGLIQSTQGVGLIFLHVDLQKVGRKDILAEIKEGVADIPIVMIADYKSVSTAVKALEKGACGYISKPFKVEEVFQIVQRQIKNGQKNPTSIKNL